MQLTRLPRPWDSPGKNIGVGCHFLLQCMKVKSEREVTQSCATLSDPLDCGPEGSSVHGIFQARVLEWGAIAFSMCYNYWSPRTVGLVNHSYSARMLQLLNPVSLEPVSHSKRTSTLRSPYTTTKKSPCLWQLEKAHAQQCIRNAVKNKNK